MEKNEFQSYEYLPVSNSNNTEADSDQFFVIQDDGNLLLNRQVQFVAEVQDANEVLDDTQCAVYNVNPQQFFVDVGNNPTEIISVADNYVLPPQIQEVNNLYSNSFLLQPVDSVLQDQEQDSEQPDKELNTLNITVQLKQVEPQADGVFSVANKQGNSCTEITLSDEQYTSLEQKGWVLLENNGKIFILDTFGLHEVTTNDDLKNLQEESKIDLPVEVDPVVGLEKDSHSHSLNVENVIIQNPTLQQDTFDSSNKYEDSDKENKLKVPKDEGNTENPKIERLFDVHEDSNSIPIIIPKKDEKETQIYSEPQSFDNSKIKIITKYNFTDIPDKIYLGRTRNGKKLIAKVVKRTDGDRNIENSNEIKSRSEVVEQSKRPNILKKKEGPSKDPEPTPIEPDMSHAAGNAAEVLAASDVITQLLQLPEFSASVAGRNLIITKETEKSLADSEPRISFVSGSVRTAENGDLYFVHEPKLLQKLTHEYEEYFRKQSSRSVLKPIPEKAPDCKIVQVHISETKHNGVQAISFILNERSLSSLSTLPGQIEFRESKKVNKLHACSTCAAIFQSEEEVAEHQETHATDSDGALTIDTDKLPQDDVKKYTIMENRYYIVNTKKGSEYRCFKCARRFNKLPNCIRHMKTSHPAVKPTKPGKEGENTDDANLKNTCVYKCEKGLEDEDCIFKSVDPPDAPFKCKMCPSAYYYAASLSKHISKSHILDKVTTMIHTYEENQSGG